MEFKKLNIGPLGVLVIAAVIGGGVLAGKFTRKDEAMPTDPAPVMDVRLAPPPKADNIMVEKFQPAMNDDTDETLKRMAEQMAKEREQQRRIKALKMQREETGLELEEQKALSELNRIKMDSIASGSDANLSDASNMNIKIVYLGGNETQREAILSIGGVDYSVKDKDRPLKNMEVQSITDNDVTIRFLAPVKSTVTYQFKSE